MRLTPDEIAAIRATAGAVFGPGAVVRLFGTAEVTPRLAGLVALARQLRRWFAGSRH